MLWMVILFGLWVSRVILWKLMKGLVGFNV
jgi:hypothetical protein